MTDNKPHFNSGNQYAKKDDVKDSQIQMRIERKLKSRFVANLYKYEKLSEFITQACINECRIREKENE